MPEPRHRLVVLGDSLAQGFSSGAIHRTELSYPAMVARALDPDAGFRVPDFSGAGGLPINLERLLRDLEREIGPDLSGAATLRAALRARRWLDAVEDYWERGPGAQPLPDARVPHLLAVWGFALRDAYAVTGAIARLADRRSRDHFLLQLPGLAVYRTARRVLNPGHGEARAHWHAARSALALARDGGIENLLVNLGGNDALGAVTSLEIRLSGPADAARLPHERRANLYRPEHFAVHVDGLAPWVERVGARRVFVTNVPHVTIAPVSRGVPAHSLHDGYYDHYTRPWVWDSDFDPDRHPHLTRDEARRIDGVTDEYNRILRERADARGWILVDLCGELDALAFRRSRGRPRYVFPAGLVAALRRRPELGYLVRDDGGVTLDTRFLAADPARPGRLARGGLIGLDGVHPTTLGYGLLADLLVRRMQASGVRFEAPLDWDRIAASDTLLARPPRLLDDLRRLLRFLDRQGVLSRLLRLLA